MLRNEAHEQLNESLIVVMSYQWELTKLREENDSLAKLKSHKPLITNTIKDLPIRRSITIYKLN